MRLAEFPWRGGEGLGPQERALSPGALVRTEQ